MVISVHLACPPAQHYLVPKNSSVTHRRRCSLFTSRKVKGMVGGGIASRSLVWGGKIMHAPYLAMMAIMMMLHSIARSFFTFRIVPCVVKVKKKLNFFIRSHQGTKVSTTNSFRHQPSVILSPSIVPNHYNYPINPSI